VELIHIFSNNERLARERLQKHMQKRAAGPREVALHRCCTALAITTARWLTLRAIKTKPRGMQVVVDRWSLFGGGEGGAEIKVVEQKYIYIKVLIHHTDRREVRRE